MMIPMNPFRTSLHSLEKASDFSDYGRASVTMLRHHFKSDPAHDEGHILRVLQNALWFAGDCNRDVLVPAAILHDLVNVPKDSPDRKFASKLSANKAVDELDRMVGLDHSLAIQIHHAIEAHSWSANVTPLTIEAKAVQDADRIEALGAIGLARLFATGGAMGRSLFHPIDPLARCREPDELTYTLDHYRVKLEKLASTMQTPLGRQVAEQRREMMHSFILDLIREL